MSESAKTPQNIIELKGLSLSLRRKELLSDLSLSLGSGECLSVVGPNGAGKTTLLRILCGLYRDYTGTAKILNQEVKSEPVESLARLVSLVPQRMEFLPGFTVSEYLELSGLGDKNATCEVSHLIGDLGPRLLPELSGGELQRVIIAGAVAQGVKLLLLDEPTANLDPSGRAQVERVLKFCRDQLGLSYILVTHDISLALRCCSRLLVMAGGKCAWSGAATDSAALRHLERAYQCGFARLEHASLAGSIVVPI
jgi:ABC-type cobalamin/Fe3+-siderophores transport system ATPase subunit